MDKIKRTILQAMGGKVLETPAQKLQIEIVLTERPKDMPFAQYKALRRKQNKAIRNAIR